MYYRSSGHSVQKAIILYSDNPDREERGLGTKVHLLHTHYSCLQLTCSEAIEGMLRYCKHSLVPILCSLVCVDNNTYMDVEERKKTGNEATENDLSVG